MKTAARRAGAWAAVVALTGLACSNKDSKWAAEQAKAQEKARLAARADREKKDQEVPAPKSEPSPADPYWDDPALVRVDPDHPCPEGLWALFPGKAPGDTPAEKKQNEQKRAQWVRQLKGTRFTTHLKSPEGVKLGDFDAPNGRFPVTFSGLIDCQDRGGHLAIAFNDPKAENPGNSAAKEGAEVQVNVWQAPASTVYLPIKSMEEAKAFQSRHRFDLEGRIIFRLGKTQVDRKVFKTTRRTTGEISIGGGAEDWGAGRMVRAVVEASRLTADHGKSTLADSRKK